MKALILIFLPVFLLLGACKKEAPSISTHPEKDILGAWTLTELVTMGGLKKQVIFRDNGLYETYHRLSGDTDWTMDADSLTYAIDQRSITLQDENTGQTTYKLTHLNAKEFRYEVVLTNGEVSSRLYRRE